MNMQVIVIAFVFLFLAVFFWAMNKLKDWQTQQDARQWLEDHWKIIVAVIFFVILLAGLMLS
jgi:heme/copper-type cytochrome/quinol oxidase subunit 1